MGLAILSAVERDARVLEVGCGYGDKMHLLESIGFENILGIEINPATLRQARERGLDVINVERFWERYGGEEFDLIVMSHIIEHFQWRELIDFMDRYLERLKEGGHLLVVTPIFQSLIFGDMDHIKTYYPHGINMVFGNADAQVQTRSVSHLMMEDIYFTRARISLVFYRALFIKTKFRIPSLINAASSILFRASFGLIGATTGWIGLYRKT